MVNTHNTTDSLPGDLDPPEVDGVPLSPGPEPNCEVLSTLPFVLIDSDSIQVENAPSSDMCQTEQGLLNLVRPGGKWRPALSKFIFIDEPRLSTKATKADQRFGCDKKEYYEPHDVKCLIVCPKLKNVPPNGSYLDPHYSKTVLIPWLRAAFTQLNAYAGMFRGIERDSQMAEWLKTGA